MAYPTQPELLSIMAKTEFKPFTKADWFCFSGCETDEPLIGYYEEFTIVIDGDIVNIIEVADEFGGQLYKLHRVV